MFLRMVMTRPLSFSVFLRIDNRQYMRQRSRGRYSYPASEKQSRILNRRLVGAGALAPIQRTSFRCEPVIATTKEAHWLSRVARVSHRALPKSLCRSMVLAWLQHTLPSEETSFTSGVRLGVHQHGRISTLDVPASSVKPISAQTQKFRRGIHSLAGSGTGIDGLVGFNAPEHTGRMQPRVGMGQSARGRRLEQSQT